MKKCLSVGAVLALMVVVAACGGSSGTQSPTGASGTSKSYAELRWASAPVRRVDVTTSWDVPTASIVSQVAEGLVTYDRAGKLIPSLATSVDHPDDTTYVYHLKPGVRFSDGKPVTVQDVVWSMQRNLGKDSQSASNYASVESISAQGPDTVVVKLKEPDVTWPNTPAFAGQVIEKAAALKGGAASIGTPSNLPIGTGPYKVASFSPDVGVTLVRNPYWRGPKPPAQKVTFKFLKDDSAIALALRSGDVDGYSQVSSKRTYQIPDVTLYPAQGINQDVISMNTLVPPFDDVHVRRAVAYALDRQGIAQAVLGGAIVDETLTPPSLYANIASPGEVQTAFGALPKYDFDLDAAKAELAKSRYPHGFTTTVVTDAGGPLTKIAQAMAPNLAAIGIKTKIKQLPDNEWLATLYGPREKLGLMPSEYGSTFPDPTSLMSSWLDPAAASVNGLNSANYRNAEVGRLLAEQRRESDGGRRLQLITKAFRLMKEDVPYAPLYTPNVYLALTNKYVMRNYSTWTATYAPWTLDVRQAS